ncbi:hypothetical protein J6590_005452 [Homalodisca vitripennis]|nr:hypothetical protein J6590_005452 [Homalodisca vitripennis]
MATCRVADDVIPPPPLFQQPPPQHSHPSHSVSQETRKIYTCVGASSPAGSRAGIAIFSGVEPVTSRSERTSSRS